ncbi:hypothetical protein NIES4101_27570 (plasmid) [Calothrix sp. NIES-4101]|nr:hypothetical protein NIES4101_27570 [Calothrix sp. NIES-4101]
MKDDFVAAFNELFPDLKGYSIKEKVALLFSPFYLAYYPPKSIKFIGKYFSSDNKCWLLFSNEETYYQPHYVTYKEEPDGSISIFIKRTNLDTTIHKSNKPEAYEVFSLFEWEGINIEWERINNEKIDLEHESLNQDAFGICNWFCEYPFPNKELPTLKFRL